MNIINRTIGLFLVLITIGCSEFNKSKYCYFKDKNGFVNAMIVVGKSEKDAIEVKKMYEENWGIGLDEFYNACIKKRLGFRHSKQEVKILKYYSNDIAKIRYYPLKTEGSLRGHTNYESLYVPIFFLHDSLPKIDTVRFRQYR